MLKKILSSIFSMEIMGLGLLLFAFSIGFATFVENKYGTIAARGVIYNAWWFELILTYAMLTMAYNVFRHKMYEPGRWGGFVFHLAFIVMIIGAGITRYFGDEGTMSIRENKTSSSYITSDNYLIISAYKGQDEYHLEEKSFVSVLKPEYINKNFKVDGLPVNVLSKGVFKPQKHGEVMVLEVDVNGVKKEVAIPEGVGLQAPLKEEIIEGISFKFGYCKKTVELPFKIELNDFILDKYPGSINPSSYKSLVTLIDDDNAVHTPFEIKMNKVLDYRGYRFFQSSYDSDEQGTILSVNKDKPGTLVSYIGYFLLFSGIVFAMFDRKSRFRNYLKMSAQNKASVLLLFFFTSANIFSSTASETAVVNMDAFNKMWVQSGDGRIKPMLTFSDEVLRKITKSRSFNNANPSEVMYGFLTNPTYWMRQDIIVTTDHPSLQKIGLQKKKASFLDFYDMNTGHYLLVNELRRIIAIPASERSKPDKYLLDLDERVQICRMIISGDFPLILPDSSDLYKPWISLSDFSKTLSDDSLALVRGIFSDDAATFNKSIAFITHYQQKYAPKALPSSFQQKLELVYTKVSIFEKLALFYGLSGMVLMLLSMVQLFVKNGIVKSLQLGMRWVLYIGFALHTVGIIARGIISGHVPLSNGYESVVFVAWSAMLAGILFSRKNTVVFSLGAILAAFSMLVSHMTFMSPQITHLVPVLRSYWLTIHVTMVTSSYGFFGAAFIIGLFNLVLMAFNGENKKSKLSGLIDELYPVGQLSMEVGLYLITIGCFLGGIWANVSWGRYWSWDPKETWCLVSILVYAFVMHMHHIPGFHSRHYFSAASVLAFSSILMTYFGVNFFLGGMHSYAGEADVSLSAPWYIATACVFGLIFVSGYRYKK